MKVAKNADWIRRIPEADVWVSYSFSPKTQFTIVLQSNLISTM